MSKNIIILFLFLIFLKYSISEETISGDKIIEHSKTDGIKNNIILKFK